MTTDLTPDQLREHAAEILLDHARDVERLSIREHLDDHGLDDHDDTAVNTIQELISTADITIAWPDTNAQPAEICGEVGTSFTTDHEPHYTDPCRLPANHDELHDWAQREANGEPSPAQLADRLATVTAERDQLVLELGNMRGIAQGNMRYVATLTGLLDAVQAIAVDLRTPRYPGQVIEAIADRLDRALTGGTAPVPGSSRRAYVPEPVLAEVAAERQRQDAKWGEQNHPDGTGPDVILRDLPSYQRAARMDHLAKWAGDQCKANSPAEDNWRDILLEEVFEALAERSPARLRAELVQVAAVAVAWMEAIDRRTEPAGESQASEQPRGKPGCPCGGTQ